LSHVRFLFLEFGEPGLKALVRSGLFLAGLPKARFPGLEVRGFHRRKSFTKPALLRPFRRT
jgi:hypothetical protein